MIALVAPWSLWLLSGLVHPFTAARRGGPGEGETGLMHQVARWLPLTWFALIFILFSIPDAKQQRYILPIVPAAALLIANVWFDHERLARRGERDRAIMPFAIIHWVGLMVASVAVTLLLGWPGWAAGLINRITGEEEPPVFAGVGVVPALLIGAFLITVAIVGLRLHRSWKPYRAAMACGVWSMAALGANWLGYSHAASGVHPLRAPTEALAAELGPAPIYELRTADMDPRLGLLNEEFRFYLGRLVRRLPVEDVPARVASGAAFHVLVRLDRITDAELEALGLEFVREVRVDKRRRMGLWKNRDGASGAGAAVIPPSDESSPAR